MGFKISHQIWCDCKFEPADAAIEGKRSLFRVEGDDLKSVEGWRTEPPDLGGVETEKGDFELVVPRGIPTLELVASVRNSGGGLETVREKFRVVEPEVSINTIKGTVGIEGYVGIHGDVGVHGDVRIQEPVGVRLQRTASGPTPDQALWVSIRNRTGAVSFNRYRRFMELALCWDERYRPEDMVRLTKRAAGVLDADGDKALKTHLQGVHAYKALKQLTEIFLLLECGVRISRGGDIRTPLDREDVPFNEEESRRLDRRFDFEEIKRELEKYLGRHTELPYITSVIEAAFPEWNRECPKDCLLSNINEPCLIELIWSYWMEEGMLVQTMNAMCQRFQNVRSSGERDPLSNLEIDPLRPLNNLLWGYIQDEVNRLSVRRRGYEYSHHYGLTLYGKAVSRMRPADDRSKFLEAFHNLLYQASVFFKEDYQTTIIPDGYPLLQSIREVHLILAQGAHNQFGDLPWTARVEMLLTQFILSRREVRDFLQSRVMVPYVEPWEGQVDAMKTLQGWTDVTVSHFRDLAVYGEQILLSIRYGNWINVNDEHSAINWARYFRAEIQGYLHAYRAVTGVDLTNLTTADTVDATMPGMLLQRRTFQQRAR